MSSLRTKDGCISYTATGRGEPVILMHCSTASGREWNSLRETLAGRFRCIAMDQWNCGDSDPWPGRAPFSLAAEAAPILDIVDRVDAPVHLVGHSYGGGVAMRVARERRGMIRSLTLIEPSVFHILRTGTGTERPLYQEISGIAQAVRSAVTNGESWGGMGAFTDYWSGKGSWERMPVEARFKLSQRLYKVMLDFKALFEEPATLADYATLTSSCLILCGECSPGPSRKIVEMLGSSMAGATVERIDGAGHMSPYTHRDPVNDAICRHLSRVERAPLRRVA